MIQAFVNTNDIEGGDEQLAHPGAVAAELDRLNDAARQVPLAARFAVGEWRLDPYNIGVSVALAWILGAVTKAIANGTWSRMKACKRDRCRWLFYDYSKNRSSVWCAMEVCGNNEKALAYRRRRRATSPP